MIWDIVHFFAILFCTFYVPIEWVTLLDFSKIYGAYWILGLTFSLLIFIFNIISTMHTGYYS